VANFDRASDVEKYCGATIILRSPYGAATNVALLIRRYQSYLSGATFPRNGRDIEGAIVAAGRAMLVTEKHRPDDERCGAVNFVRRSQRGSQWSWPSLEPTTECTRPAKLDREPAQQTVVTQKSSSSAEMRSPAGSIALNNRLRVGQRDGA
jgi:hypothetical protein